MLMHLTYKRQIYNELWILTIAAPPINYTRIFFPNSFKMSREWVKPKKKSRGGTWFMRFQIRKKNTTKGVVVVKCCFKEKVQYYYVCSAHSKCNSTAQPVFTWIHLCTKFLNPSNSFVVCTSETTSRPINPFFSSVQCTFKSSWCLQV